MKLITLLTVLSLINSYSFAQPGSLDLSFNDSGKIFMSGFGRVRASTVQEDGKILVGGENYSHAFTVARFMPDGTLDASFGENGIITTSFIAAGIYSLAVLKDGKILASGYGYTSSNFDATKSPLLVKYLPDGSLDPSFGNGGTVALDLSNLDGMVATTMGVMEDGRIVQAGSSGSAMNNTSATTVIRYLPNGTPDVSFDEDGVYTLPVGALPTIKVLALQPDGKIILGGEYSSGDGGNFYITRLTTGGAIDSSFGINGKRNLNFYNNEDVINALALQPDGKILATGRVDKNGLETPVMTLVRFKPNGFFDSSFGKNGIAFADFGVLLSGGNGIVLQKDGKITVGGFAKTVKRYDEGGQQFFGLAQFNPDGSPNNAFGEKGVTTTNFGYIPQINSISLQADNRIVAAGQVIIPANAESLPYWNLGIARYNNNGISIAQKIKKLLRGAYNHNNGVNLSWPAITGISGDYYRVQRSANGNALIWQNIGTVAVAADAQTFSFTDNNPQAGTNYYRVQQVAANGNTAISNVVAVTANPATIIILSPNPAQNVLHLQGFNTSESYNVQVVNAQGATIAKAIVKEADACNLNIQALNKGIYYLKVTGSNNITTSLKFVKE